MNSEERQTIPAPELIDDVVVRFFRIPSEKHSPSFEAHVDPVRDEKGKVIRTAPTMPELVRQVVEVLEGRADRAREEDLRQFRAIASEEQRGRIAAEEELRGLREQLAAAGIEEEKP